MDLKREIDFVVIGGGAAGFMAAIKAAEDGVRSVVIFEKTGRFLEKVRISGGGRCNVTNACWVPKDLAVNYPRGQTALIGAFSNFASGDALSWFEERGLELVAEKDGRLFPKSNSSNEVIVCLKKAAKRAGVIFTSQMPIKDITYLGNKGFLLKSKDENIFHARKILLATGGDASGKKLASNLGHNLISAVPSLFSFKFPNPSFKECSGTAINNVKLRLLIQDSSFEEEGRILITHQGISGPAVLKLSAFAARKLHESKYKAQLLIRWVNKSKESIHRSLINFRIQQARKLIINVQPFDEIPKRLWSIILMQINIPANLKWSSLSKSQENILANFLYRNSILVVGKGPYGEEFVTAGGVDLKEVQFKTMESRLCKGLYFAGEILNVDGLTGGFNFQHCWTSAWIAGKSVAKELKV